MLDIPGLLVRSCHVAFDRRGSFTEGWRADWSSWCPTMVQHNISRSYARVLRGMHVHLHQYDLWRVEAGQCVLAFCDLRDARRPFATVETRLHSADLYLIPPGVAHGYLALTDATISYFVSQFYDGTDEHGIRWDALGIDWPIRDPILSDRDASAPVELAPALAEKLKQL